MEKLDVFRRLERTNPSGRHIQALRYYESDTGGWVFRTPEWDGWRSRSDASSCLWLHGIPGSGKTVLISHIIDHIEQTFVSDADNGKICAVYYYCHYENKQNEAAPMLFWVLSQLCRKSDVLPCSAYALVKKGIQPTLADLLEAVADALSPFQLVYLAVDAVDEAEQRFDLLDVLRQLATEGRFHKIRLVVASREYLDIEHSMSSFSISLPLFNDVVTKDIRKYLERALAGRIEAHRHFISHPRWTDELRAMILEKVSVKANGM